LYAHQIEETEEGDELKTWQADLKEWLKDSSSPCMLCNLTAERWKWFLKGCRVAAPLLHVFTGVAICYEKKVTKYLRSACTDEDTGFGWWLNTTRVRILAKT